MAASNPRAAAAAELARRQLLKDERFQQLLEEEKGVAPALSEEPTEEDLEVFNLIASLEARAAYEGPEAFMALRSNDDPIQAAEEELIRRQLDKEERQRIEHEDTNRDTEKGLLDRPPSDYGLSILLLANEIIDALPNWAQTAVGVGGGLKGFQILKWLAKSPVAWSVAIPSLILELDRLPGAREAVSGGRGEIDVTIGTPEGGFGVKPKKRPTNGGPDSGGGDIMYRVRSLP